MTQFNLETTSKLSVQSYSDKHIDIALAGSLPSSSGGVDDDSSISRMTNSFILTPSQVIQDWTYSNVDDFTAGSFDLLLQQQPELILLGTGSKIQFPSQQLLQNVHQAGIGIEVMNNASACRTFNVLVSENRFVVAGFLIN